MIGNRAAAECRPGLEGYCGTSATDVRSDRGGSIVPSLHHRKEGWPSDQENAAEHPLKARTGWFSNRRVENHPACGSYGGYGIILDDAATPPCGNARRGRRLRPRRSFRPLHSFTINRTTPPPLSNSPARVGLSSTA